MRRRITRALLATAAAGATITTLGLGAVGSAGAAITGPHPGKGHRLHAPSAPPIATPPCRAAIGYVPPPSNPNLDSGGCAGYLATGRDFRYAQAIIRIPLVSVNQSTDVPTASPGVTAPTMDIGLTANNAVASAGIMSCPAYLHVFGPTFAPPQCTTPAPPANRIWLAVMLMANNALGTVIPRAIALNSVSPGDGVRFAIYYNQQGNAVHMTVTAPSGVVLAANSFFAGGAIFNHAAALVDWSSCPSPTPPAVPVAGQCGNAAGATVSTPVPGPVPTPPQIRVTQFQAGAFTTANGERGSFTGPWTLNSVLATSNGILPPGGTVQVTPEFLWTDGLPGTMPNDAFGVWWR